MPSVMVSPFDSHKLSTTVFQDDGLLHFWKFSVRYKLSTSDVPDSRSAIRLLDSDDVPVGFLYHFDNEKSRNHDLPITGEVLLLSGSDFSPLTDKPAQTAYEDCARTRGSTRRLGQGE